MGEVMDIIELAKQAGLVRNGDIGMKRWEGPQSDSISDQDLEKFAALVEAAARADEREECAKFCETNQVWVGKGKRGFSEWGEEEFVTGGIHQGMDYAAAIRARGTT
jgi:hypothetical protein